MSTKKSIEPAKSATETSAKPTAAPSAPPDIGSYKSLMTHKVNGTLPRGTKVKTDSINNLITWSTKDAQFFAMRLDEFARVTAKSQGFALAN